MKKRTGISISGRRWWISYTVGGQRVRRSVGPEDALSYEQVAKIRAVSIGKAIAEGENIAPKKKTPPPPPLTLGELRDEYGKARPGSAAHFRHLVRALGDGPVGALTDVALLGYREKRAGASPLTISHELSTLRAAVGWAERSGRPVGRNVFRTLTTADRKTLFSLRGGRKALVLTPAEVEAIAVGLPPRSARLVRFLAATGMRLGEAKAMVWRNVHAGGDDPRVVLPVTKNGDERIVPLSDAARAILGAAGGIGRVFVGVANVERAWRKARAAAKPPDGTPPEKLAGARIHDLRHSFATRFVKRGGDAADLRDVCGWRDLTIASRYVHAERDRARAVLNAPSEDDLRAKADADSV